MASSILSYYARLHGHDIKKIGKITDQLRCFIGKITKYSYFAPSNLSCLVADVRKPGRFTKLGKVP